MSTLIRVVCVNNNITINFQGQVIMINKDKNPALYDKITKKVVDNNVKWIEDNFKSIKDTIEKQSGGLFSVDKQQVVLKGTSIPVPTVIRKKLVELDQQEDKTHMLALLRFWYKLEKNPFENARKDLYEFMTRHNVPITDQGDIVVEKGVDQKKGSYIGHLVDCRTGLINNSVGREVFTHRDNVDSDSSRTCSAGLHVGAPDYVRNHWSSDVIVECVVDPVDVVSVPKDYNATKMRVCRYKVMGYSNKTRLGSKVVSLKDFLDQPSANTALTMAKKCNPDLDRQEKVTEVAERTTTEPIKEVEDTIGIDLAALESKTAQQIVSYVLDVTGEMIAYSLKSKKSILKKAIALLKEHEAKENIANLKSSPKKVDMDFKKITPIMKMTKKELIAFAKSKFNETIKKRKSRQEVLVEVVELCKKANYQVEDTE